MFFIIQVARNVRGFNPDDPNHWDQWEVYPELWVARNRLTVMRRNRPDIPAEQFRVIACRKVNV